MDRVVKAVGRIGMNAKSISLDGSSFDSSQFEILTESVDCRIWRKLEPTWSDVINHNDEFFKIPGKLDRDLIKNRVRNALTQHSKIVFYHFPGLNGPKWPK